ncbi:hypothetical protein ABT269_38475 [Streptomyces viridosporus]|uniref:DUF6927 domain-containing protein n=1 Tax=Streptomyces viridosporus TaxID=67581 RepID=UPI00332E25FE
MLTRWRRAEPNFGYKDLGETSGPADCKAPQAVLDALTPTTHEEALIWRANCRRHHAQRAFLRTHLTPGTRLRLTHPLLFSDGTERGTFTYTRTGRRPGVLIHGSTRYTIPHWRDRVAALLTPVGSETLTPVGEHHIATRPAPDRTPHPPSGPATATG